MKKKPLTARRPQDAMARFDRLLTQMAPKADAPKTVAPKRTPKKRLTPRRQDAK
jgi:hypothetical protein